MASNIRVIVRVRPLNERELQHNDRTVVQVIDESHLVLAPKEDFPCFAKAHNESVQQHSFFYMKGAYKEKRKYAFDYVCGPGDTNEAVFEKATKDMLACLMDGHNCSVLAYGATGAGKTYTMIGNKDYPGIIYLTVDHLFTTIEEFQIDREFDISVSYLEVYNENVYDLLMPSHTPLQLRDFPQCGSVTVAGLSTHQIKTAGQLLHFLEYGNWNRTQHPTDTNAESSRSHAVFQVYLKMHCKAGGPIRTVKLSMIDLAGSERAAATGCVGERFKEGANINRSLLALGNCINRLTDGSLFVPYRDSKLTRLLKDSLDGNCNTVMIANVSPSSLSYDDTHNTLNYAARAHKIQINYKQNIVDLNMDSARSGTTIEELQKRIDDLEKENKEIKEEKAWWERKAKELQAEQNSATTIAALEKEIERLQEKNRQHMDLTYVKSPKEVPLKPVPLAEFIPRLQRLIGNSKVSLRQLPSLKPVLALPHRPLPALWAPPSRRPAFGSSAPRDGANYSQAGPSRASRAARGRGRDQIAPYPRPDAPWRP